MNNNESSEKRSVLTRRWLTLAGIVLAVVVLLIFIVINSSAINTWFISVFRLFRPILAGLILAYLLNPIFRFFERRAFRKLHPLSLRRSLALICAYLFLLLIVVLLFALIIPQLVSSITKFVANYPTYLETATGHYNNFVTWLDNFLDRFKATQSFLLHITPEEINASLDETLGDPERLLTFVRQLVPQITQKGVISAVGGVISSVTSIVFAFFISLYLLASKERSYAFVMKLRRGMFDDRFNSYITKICTIADRSFGSFLEGKFFDSLIIGFLTYFILLIFRIPYPVLNAAIIGITNIVPIIGPIFGAIPTAIIVMLDDPAKVIPFLLIVLVIQQVDGNIIGPKILGRSNGVSSLCVLLAIMILGKFWGFVGMLIGVPLFATALDLLETFLRDRLRTKGLPSTTENYYPPDSPLDPATDMQSGSKRSLHKLEMKVLHLQMLQENGEKLSKWNCFLMWIYKKAKKVSAIPDISAGTRAQFAVDEVIRAKEQSAEQKD